MNTAAQTRRLSDRKDALGDMLKGFEARESSRTAMPGLPVYVRIDGASFSRFTRGMARPYDKRLSRAMIETTKRLVQDFQCVIGYTQSDEISLVLWEADGELPYGGRYQKLASRTAAKATAAFTQIAMKDFPEAVARRLPEFDSRVFELPTLELCVETLRWRELDATKNAVSMAARAFFPHKELQGRSSSEMQEMMFSKHGENFNDYPAFFKRGTFVRRLTEARSLTDEEMSRIPAKHRPTGLVTRSRIAEIPMPPFSKVINRVDVVFRGADPLTA